MSRNYTISFSISAKTFWRTVVPLTLVLILAGAVSGVLVVDRLIMPNVVGVNKGIVSVPDVAGMQWEGARQKLYDVGLVGRIKHEEFSDSIPADVVVRQYVDAGSSVKRGRHIDVAVSRGPEVAEVPAVRGLAEHVAKLELRKKGFKINRIQKKYHERVPTGHVVAADPPEGTTISREMGLTLYVSDGPKPTHAEMVNVVGESLGNARVAIGEAGLKVGRVDYRNNPDLAPGTVLSQSVPPGTAVPLESSVDLVVSVIRN